METNAIVIDNGSSTSRVGVSGEDSPLSVFPTVVGNARHSSTILSNKIDYIGNETKSTVHRIFHPMDKGIVNDFTIMEKIWEHTFEKILKVSPMDHPVFLTENPLNLKFKRVEMIKSIFETFLVPELYIADQSVLSLIFSGRFTGIVLDSGDTISHSVPIYEGHAIKHAMVKIDFGGKDLTNYLSRKLNHHFKNTFSDYITIREIKEKMCYVSEDHIHEMTELQKQKNLCKTYTLPDGIDIQIEQERFTCMEAMFDPSHIGSESPGFHEGVALSIKGCDFDLKKEFCSNILLSGGSTMFQGMDNRMKKEVSSLFPAYSNCINVIPSIKNATWCGGSVLASLSTFKDIFVTRDEYDEFGYTIFDRKCF
jgi:actin-related protein